MSDIHSPSLTRARGVAIYLSALLGAGLLAMPAVTYQAAGASSLVAWGIMLALSVPVALTFARLGAHRPDPAGIGGYASQAFGARAGDAVGFWFVLGVPFGAPATALVGAAYVSRAAGWSTTATPWVAAALMAAAAASAWAGLRLSGSVQIVLTAVLFLTLVMACVGALRQASVQNLHPFAPHGATGIASAVGVLFFSFAGWEAVAPITGEFADPRRDVMRVTWLTLVLVTGLYLTLSVMSVLTLGPELGRTGTPVQMLLAGTLGRAASPLTAVLAAILTYGAMTAYVSGAARMASALARSGRLPTALASGTNRGDTPRPAVTTVSLAALVVLVVTSLADTSLHVLLTLSSAAFIAVTEVGLLAGARLLPERAEKAQAAVAAAVMLVVLAGCGWAALYPLAVAVLAAAPRRAPTGQGRNLPV